MFVIAGDAVDFAGLIGGLQRADGNQSFNGWANSARLEAEVAAWYEAESPGEEKAIGRRLNKAALDDVLYAPLGAHLLRHAWRKNVSGFVQAPLPLFWGVSKTA